MTVSNRMTPSLPLTRLAGLLVATSLAGCTVVSGVGDDRIDYRSQGQKTRGLDVPPDLTQLARDSRYQQGGGTVSATTFQSPTAVAAAAPSNPAIAPSSVGDFKMEREGNVRWLHSTQSAEVLWPQIEAFWKERGLNLIVDQPEAGAMETDWAENRANLPQDIIRKTLGKVLDSVYDTSLRDKFSTRVERVPSGGTNIYVVHRGMQEIYTGGNVETRSTVWQPRPADPVLEAEILQRLMVRLGGTEASAKQEAAIIARPNGGSGPNAISHARAVPNLPAATMEVDANFDRAWRQVGLSLDRSGFTVEDRDRTQGIFYVRYVDPALAGRDEPNFFQRMFGFGRKDEGPSRYRVLVKAGEGDAKSIVSVQTNAGQPENGEAGKRIVRLLVEDLK